MVGGHNRAWPNLSIVCISSWLRQTTQPTRAPQAGETLGDRVHHDGPVLVPPECAVCWRGSAVIGELAVDLVGQQPQVLFACQSGQHLKIPFGEDRPGGIIGRAVQDGFGLLGDPLNELSLGRQGKSLFYLSWSPAELSSYRPWWQNRYNWCRTARGPAPHRPGAHSHKGKNNGFESRRWLPGRHQLLP